MLWVATVCMALAMGSCPAPAAAIVSGSTKAPVEASVSPRASTAKVEHPEEKDSQVEAHGEASHVHNSVYSPGELLLHGESDKSFKFEKGCFLPSVPPWFNP